MFDTFKIKQYISLTKTYLFSDISSKLFYNCYHAEFSKNPISNQNNNGF